jgi:hypothetical protein
MVVSIRRLCVVGSRSILNVPAVHRVLSLYDPSLVITGGARGVDSIAYQFYRDQGIKQKQYIVKPSDYAKLGNFAYRLRNKAMCLYADSIVALWDGKSRGTWHSFEFADQFNIPIAVYKYDPDTRSFQQIENPVVTERNKQPTLDIYY